MAISSSSFKSGHQTNLGKRNAAKERRITFSKELFFKHNGRIEKVFENVLSIAENKEDERFIDAAKLLFRHFITVPPAEILADMSLDSEDSLRVENELIAHGFTLDEVEKYRKILAEKAKENAAAALEEVIKQRAKNDHS